MDGYGRRETSTRALLPRDFVRSPGTLSGTCIPHSGIYASECAVRDAGLGIGIRWIDRHGIGGGFAGCRNRPNNEHHALLDHLIRPRQQRGWDREAERLGGLEIDDELKLRGLLDGEISGLGALQDSVDVELLFGRCRAARRVRSARLAL